MTEYKDPAPQDPEDFEKMKKENNKIKEKQLDNYFRRELRLEKEMEEEEE